MMAHGSEDGREPRILVFSTNSISDPGIDLAGSAHMHYSTAVQVIPVPCSSGIKASWVAHALEKGFDGVFVAAMRRRLRLPLRLHRTHQRGD